MTELLKKLEDAINDIDCLYNGDFHKDSELSRVLDRLEDAYNRLKEI